VSEWSFCFIAVTDLNKIFGFTIFRLLAYPQFLVGFVPTTLETSTPNHYTMKSGHEYLFFFHEDQDYRGTFNCIQYILFYTFLLCVFTNHRRRLEDTFRPVLSMNGRKIILTCSKYKRYGIKSRKFVKNGCINLSNRWNNIFISDRTGLKVSSILRL
jgi:hypothetical protein